MTRYAIVLVAMLAFTGAQAFGAETPAPTILAPAQMHWKAGIGPLAGTQVARLIGDPSKPGTFVTRIRFPDGHRVAPHYHAVMENVTVLQGTLMLGVGSKADTSKMIALPAGSFFSLPPNVPHYAIAKGVTIIQLNDLGPWSMHTATHP